MLGEVLTAIVTPFNPDGSVNVPKFRELAAYLVENGDYGAALRQGETLAKADGAAADVKAAVTKLATVARLRQDNRFLRIDGLVKDGNKAQALADAQRILDDFKGTSLEARAKERVDALSTPPK